jgi:tRNA A37 threonylcarbamoyladenosine biosynthesis protein TsaE
MAGDGVLVIEWGDAVEGALPGDQLRVEFAVEPDESRTLRLTGLGSWSDRPLEVLA